MHVLLGFTLGFFNKTKKPKNLVFSVFFTYCVIELMKMILKYELLRFLVFRDSVWFIL